MDTEPDVNSWNEADVRAWLSSIGYRSYHEIITEHGISGDVLIHLDFDNLRDIGITSAGHRLDILRAIYKLKLDNGIPIEADHYVPLSEADEDVVTENTPLGRIIQMITNQNQRMQNLEQALMALEDHIFNNRAPGANGLHNRSSLRWSTYGKPVLSSTRSVSEVSTALGIQPQDSPWTSPQAMNHEGSTSCSSTPQPSKAAENDEVYLPPAPYVSFLQTHPLFKWATYGKPVLSSTESILDDNTTSRIQLQDSLRTSPQAMNHDSPAPGSSPFKPSSAVENDEARSFNQRIQNLERGNQRSPQGLMALEDHIFNGRAPGANGLHKHPSLKWATYGKPALSLTRPVPDVDNTALGIQPQDSPQTSRQAMYHDGSAPGSSTLKPSKATESVEVNIPAIDSSSRNIKRPAGEDRSDNVFPSFKVSLDDPCSKVLPAALKKYRITDDWRLYTLFICYGSTERCLSLDEKPLLLFKKLKDAGKNPVFMLRHVRDIRAPITVAQDKQAEKKAKSIKMTSPTDPTKRNDQATNSLYSPLQKTSMQSIDGLTSIHHEEYNESRDSDQSRTPSDDSSISDGARRQTGNGPGHTDAVILWNGTSYAMAIYPYGADYDDEFDVTVGAMFVVLRRSKGWWQVQRDPSGSGAVNETAKRGWVPTGCLLETSVPPATAVAEATALARPGSLAALSLSSPAFAQFPMSDAPILSSSIISTSYPGIALMDWLPQGDHELDLVKDDMLRVFKRYNHWSYVVKEGGRRGWVPSWLIGKASSSNGIPQTSMTEPGHDGNSEDAAHASRGLEADISHSPED
ncbi:Adaptor for signal transduction [Tulasnella sp. 330]|nr:Adaptor for signal transduction [Tulasnella sp. 330]